MEENQKWPLKILMSALKKPECRPNKKNNQLSITDDNTLVQKSEIEQMKKVIAEKIKNPALARKAAMIISEMLDKK